MNDYTYLYKPWFESYISQHRMCCGYPSLFREIEYHIVYRDEKWIILKYSGTDTGKVCSLNSVVNFIKETGHADIISAYHREKKNYITYAEGTFKIDGTEKNEQEIISFLSGLKYEYFVTHHVKPFFSSDEKLYLTVLLNRKTDTFNVTDAYFYLELKADNSFECIDAVNGKGNMRTLENWEKIKSSVIEIAGNLAFFELLSFEITVTDSGFIIEWVHPGLFHPEYNNLSETVKRFVSQWKYRVDNPTEDHRSLLQSQKETDEIWTEQVIKNHRTGMRSYMARFWDGEMKNDLDDELISDKDKQWAHNKGWFSYRIEELGLNDSNSDKYVCDYDYFWVNRINGSYQSWIQDKLATRFSMHQFKNLLPDYYYAINNINGDGRICSLPDLPKNLTNTCDDFFKLLHHKGILAIKASYGSHGIGFYRAEEKDGLLYLDGEETTREEIIKILYRKETVQLVTEYITMHSFLRNIYPDALNTVRVNCFNKDGENPVIGACFLKFGHSKGGFTDNINTAAGGISVGLDKKTGRIILPEFKRGNHYSQCHRHPDTGVVIEGHVPHWDLIIDSVKKIVQSVPQLQYFGFDIAVEPDGIRIIEINVFPDYTKYVVKDEETQEFLKHKLNQKRKQLMISQSDTLIEFKNPEIQYKFSIVIPIYNSADYLEETIKSIINQKMAFKENVEIILCDDGSTDRSKEICSYYQKLYPNNIRYEYSEHKGILYTRNRGKNLARGKYVNFLDANDRIGMYSLKLVWEFFEKHYDEIDVVDTQGEWFGKRKGMFSNNHRFVQGTRVTDVLENPFVTLTVSNTAFYKWDAIKDLYFDEELPYKADVKFNSELIVRKGKFGLVKGAYYFKRAKSENDSETSGDDAGQLSIIYELLERYYKWTYELSKSTYGKVISYFQNMIIGDIKRILPRPLPSDLEFNIKERYAEAVKYIIENTDLQTIKSLQNQTIGDLTNFVRYKTEGSKDAGVALNGDTVFFEGNELGKFNNSGALTILDIDQHVFSRVITAEIMLPWFVKPSQLEVEDAHSKSKFDIQYKKIGGNEDIFGNPVYTRYSVTVKLKKKGSLKLSFFLKTSGSECQLYPNRKNDNPKVQRDSQRRLLVD